MKMGEPPFQIWMKMEIYNLQMKFAHEVLMTVQ